MLDAAGRRVPRGRACGPGCRSCSPGAPGLGQDHAAVVLRRRARPVAAGRHRRGGLRGRRPAAQRRQHADPAGPGRPARGRPPPARRRLPAHGARRRHRRRGPRPRGAAAAAHAVVGRQGLHHDPRRLGPPGAHPAALHLPAGRHGQRAAAVGAQHAGERGDRRRRALRPRARRARGSPRSSRSRTSPAGPTPTQFTVTERVRPAAARRPAALDRATSRCGSAARFDDAGRRPARACSGADPATRLARGRR